MNQPLPGVVFTQLFVRQAGALGSNLISAETMGKEQLISAWMIWRRPKQMGKSPDRLKSALRPIQDGVTHVHLAHYLRSYRLPACCRRKLRMCMAVITGCSKGRRWAAPGTVTSVARSPSSF